MLLRRALPAARRNLAHSFPIGEMGSSRLVGCWLVIAGDAPVTTGFRQCN